MIGLGSDKKSVSLEKNCGLKNLLLPLIDHHINVCQWVQTVLHHVISALLFYGSWRLKKYHG